jgi:hypothetical protein
VEAELAWAFRPYLYYDNDENHSGDTLVLYQASLIQNHPQSIKIRLKWFFLMRAEARHHGDSNGLNAIVESTDPFHRQWMLVKAGWRECKDPRYEKPSCRGERMDHEWNISEGRSHEPIKWSWVSWDDGESGAVTRTPSSARRLTGAFRRPGTGPATRSSSLPRSKSPFASTPPTRKATISPFRPYKTDGSCTMKKETGCCWWEIARPVM